MCLACISTTRGFDSKKHCSGRVYKYMLPTYSFAPVEKVMFFNMDSTLCCGLLNYLHFALSV